METKTDEKQKFPKIAPVLHLGKLKFRLIHDFDRYSNGSMLMRVAGCEGKITTDEGKELGNVGAAMGATIFVQIGGRTWTLNPVELFEAVQAAEKEQYL